jgi:DNA-binding response OmpR family regulator
MNIVVIDDEPLVMQLCVEVLEQDGHRVDGFTRGEDALIKLASQPTDLLVVDCKMPGLNGFEVIQRARCLRPDLRVVMITGDGASEIIGEAMQVGVNGIILKPFIPNELSTAVASAVGEEAKPPA